MSKRNMVKVGGFIATMAAGAALVGSAVTGTGAYFTDSDSGSLTASSGHLTLSTHNTSLQFANLIPGQDKTENIAYSVGGDTESDVWMVFDKTTAAYGAFSGASGAGEPFPGGGLGRFGHFLVSNNGNGLFQSFNLKNPPAGVSGPTCGIDADGHGSGSPATSVSDTPPFCGVPGAIKIASNLSPGQSGTLNVTFGLTGRATDQGAGVASVPFTVVATQHNVRPDAANF